MLLLEDVIKFKFLVWVRNIHFFLNVKFYKALTHDTTLRKEQHAIK